MACIALLTVMKSKTNSLFVHFGHRQIWSCSPPILRITVSSLYFGVFWFDKESSASHGRVGRWPMSVGHLLPTGSTSLVGCNIDSQSRYRTEVSCRNN